MTDFTQIFNDNVTTAYYTNDGYQTASRPQGLHWMAATASISPRSSRDVTVTPGDDLDTGQGQSTVVTLGQLVVNTTLRLPAGKDFAAMKNHTVMVSSLMFAVGVLGNVLALCVLATSGGDHRKSLFYTLVAGLAVTDLLGTCSTSPVVIAVYLNDFKWVGGEATCHYFSFAMIFAGYATMLIVCAMSVERYVCVRHPYTYHTRLSGSSLARLTLLGCWALSLSIASLPLLGLGSNVRQYPATWCFFDFNSRRPSDRAFNYIYATIALVCVSVTFVCNVSVIYTLVTLRARQSRLDASESCREPRSGSGRWGGGGGGGSAKVNGRGGGKGEGDRGGEGGGRQSQHHHHQQQQQECQHNNHHPHHHHHHHRNQQQHQPRTKRRTRRATSQRFAEVQMMIMLIGVTVVFTICFAPLMELAAITEELRTKARPGPARPSDAWAMEIGEDEIFVLVCQTGLQFDSRRWVLTLVRVASFNPILDPWVYILFRRELVWRAVRLVRWVLRLDSAPTATPAPALGCAAATTKLLIKDPAGGGGGIANGNGGGARAAAGGVAGGEGGVAELNGEGGGGAGRGTGGVGVGEKTLSPWEDPYNPSCLAFCYQCLCLPPAPRTPASMASLRQSVTAASVRSPSPRRAASGATPRHSLVTQPTSPGDRLLLLKMAAVHEDRGSSRSLNSNL